MKLLDASREFRIRHYQREISEFRREIDLSFPNLRLFKAGYGRAVYDYMRHLKDDERIALATALLKQLHPAASEALGETLSISERSLAGMCRIQLINLEIETEKEDAARKQAGEKIVFISKRKLCESVIVAVKNTFGAKCSNIEWRSDGDWVASFDVKHDGWVVKTYFWFGRQESLIEFHHLIGSETQRPHPRHPELMIPAISLIDPWCVPWLGFNKFIRLQKADVPVACNTVMRFCEYFFDGLPILLNGINSENLQD